MEQIFWKSKYQQQQTGWNLGEVSPPFKAYIDQLDNKSIRILIPGCGFGLEAKYAFENGFKNVFILDFVPEAIELFLQHSPDFPTENCLIEDVFTHQNTYDLIFEQTLFCAIDPSSREAYINQIQNMLAPNGKFVGVLFDRDFEGGPPFGGSKETYMYQFGAVFSAVEMNACYNSIAPRNGTEVFFIAKK